MPLKDQLISYLSSTLRLWNGRKLEHIRLRLVSAGLFDQDYYLGNYPDVQGAGMSPFEHFIYHGFLENRVPSPEAETLTRHELRNALETAGVAPKFLMPKTRTGLSANTKPAGTAKCLRHFKTIAQLNQPGRKSLFTYLDKLFDQDEYLAEYPDLQFSDVDPKLHYFKAGYYEQRLPCRPESMDRKIKQLLVDIDYLGDPVCQEYRYAPRRDTGNTAVIVSYSNRGNFFFQEIAENLHQGLLEAGYPATLVSDEEINTGINGHLLVVAPHEYFGFINGKALYALVRDNFPHRTYYVTEQPQSKFGLIQLQYLFDGANILDINLASCVLSRKLNINAYFLPVGPLKTELSLRRLNFNNNIDNIFIDKSVRDYNVETESSVSERPLDILYIANSSPRRDEFIATHSRLFNKYKSFLFAPFWPLPHRTDSSATLDINNALALCQRSKLLLNIHRDGFQYFEWHRIFSRGMKSGNVVVTEPMYAIPGLVSGHHYLEYPLEEIPERIRFLLSTAEGRTLCDTVSRNARAAFASWEPLSCSLDAFFKHCDNI